MMSILFNSEKLQGPMHHRNVLHCSEHASARLTRLEEAAKANEHAI